MNSPHHTIVNVPPIVYAVPAIYRRKFGPFAVMDLPQEAPDTMEMEPQEPSEIAEFVYRCAIYFAAMGAAAFFAKVYL